MSKHSPSSPSSRHDLQRWSDAITDAMCQGARYRRRWLIRTLGTEGARALVEVKEQGLQSESPKLYARLQELDRFEFAILLAFLEVKTGRLWE